MVAASYGQTKRLFLANGSISKIFDTFSTNRHGVSCQAPTSTAIKICSFFLNPRLIKILLLILVLLPALVRTAKAEPSTTLEYSAGKGVPSRISLSKQEQTWLDQKHTVRVRVASSPPYHMSAPDPQGISVDYLNLIGKRFGINFIFANSPVSWQDALNDIAGKRTWCDLLITIKKTSEREKQISFTKHYVTSPWVIVNSTNANFVSQMQDLNGKTVVVERGFVIKDLIEKEYPRIKVITVETSLDALKSVSSGHSDAYIANLAVASFLINANGLNNLKIAAPTPFGNHDQSMGIRKDWPELVSIINKALESMTEAEENEIRNRWLSIRYEDPLYRKKVVVWIAGLTTLFALIVTVVLAWNRRLKCEISNRMEIEGKLRETNAYLDNLFNYANAPIIVWDSDFKITRFNKAFEVITGRTSNEVVGKDITILFPDDLTDSYMDLIRRTLSGERWETVEIKIKHLDSSVRTLLWNSATLLEVNGTTPLATIAQGHDITKRKQAEEKLQKRDAELEQFIYTVSHDLRSPLVTIKTFLGYLEKDIADNNQERVSQDYEFIYNATDKMRMLLDELLELSRIDHTESSPTWVSIKELTSEVLVVLAGIISSRNCTIALPDTDMRLFGDRQRFFQIFQNLIENAIKYSSSDVPPRIELEIQHVNADTVFCIKDNGIGIEPQYHSKIFGIFDKIDPLSSGAGLGLSMVKRIVNKYNGRIWVESDGTGTGSCFCFTLPGAVHQGKTASGL